MNGRGVTDGMPTSDGAVILTEDDDSDVDASGETGETDPTGETTGPKFVCPGCASTHSKGGLRAGDACPDCLIEYLNEAEEVSRG